MDQELDTNEGTVTEEEMAANDINIVVEEDEAEADVVDDVVVDDPLAEETEEEEEEDPYKVGLDEILDPNADEDPFGDR